jgi:hypothetical protein
MSGPQIAARLEALALADAAEVLVLLQPVLNDLRCQASADTTGTRAVTSSDHADSPSPALLLPAVPSDRAS